ncbi:cytidylate kinase family protein [Terasakiella sp. A23]|uniref:cytidylate kinase-like family protein n=1 Tax=Terasakiella sp. FCG-A23 TaxID=3080561 RepID=UPI002953C9B7|nr:cytidylate kinase family protein [Terasakiella sp. A23]MDV7341593.1 cytidylate kinase family protein [Terasakiella sp. A23]
MTIDVQGVIQALSRAVEVSPLDTDQTLHPVITLSRDLGTGGDAIATMLAERMGLEIYDEDIMDAISQRSDVNKSVLKNLHEKVSSASDSWLYAMVMGKNVSREEYVQALVTVIRAIYHKGGIIMGRGAHVVLAGRDVLRVRLTGSREACAKRVAHREHLTLTEAKKKCAEINKERGQFVWAMFKSRLNDPTNFDLTINTDHFAHYEQIVETIMRAMEMMGYSKRRTGTSNR